MTESQAVKYKFFLTDSLEKIMPNKDYEAAGNLEQIYGFKNEPLSFQLAYRMEYDGCEIHLQELETEFERESALELTGFDVKAVPATLSAYQGQLDEDYLFKKAELCPDILMPQKEKTLRPAPNQWKSLWIFVRANEKAEKDTYQIEVIIKKAGEEIWKRQIVIYYASVNLPKQKLIHTEWLHTDCLANYYQVEVFSGEYWRIVENFIKTASKNGINMIFTPIFTPPLDTVMEGERTTVQLVKIKKEGDNYTFDFEKLEYWIELCRKCGIEYFEFCHLFTQWGARYAPKILVEENGALIKKFGWHTLATGKEYRDFLWQFLPRLIEFLKSKSILESCYFHISDEPHEQDWETYRAARDSIKELLSECKVIDALSSYELYAKGLVEKPVVCNDAIQRFIDEKAENLWTYYCCVQGNKVSNRFMSMPLSRLRIIGIQLYLYHIEGFLHWGYNFYNSQLSKYSINPYLTTDADGGFPSGDPFVVYPAEDGAAYESIRLAVFSEALNDLRMLQLLEEKKGREYVEGLIRQETDNPITFTEYPRDKEYIKNLRAKVYLALKNC